jgi:ADP-ribosylglycohydrolase
VCNNTCQAAYVCLYASTSFEDCIRNCMSIGGDSDTIGAIAGSIAEACHGIPLDIQTKGRAYLDDRLLAICNAFEARYKAT